MLMFAVGVLSGAILTKLLDLFNTTSKKLQSRPPTASLAAAIDLQGSASAAPATTAINNNDTATATQTPAPTPAEPVVQDDDGDEDYEDEDDEDDAEEENPNERKKLVLVVRQDLKMGTGKMCAQCSHATLGVYQDVVTRYNKDKTNASLKAQMEWLKQWKVSGCAKIVVKANDEETLYVHIDL